MKANNIGELFGTLQQSVVAEWRKHLQTGKYSKHMALDEFYKDMPEAIDDLIEAYQGHNSVKVEDYKNIIDATKYDALGYLEALHDMIHESKYLLEGSELLSLLDECLSIIDSTMYKLRELKEDITSLTSLKSYIKEQLVVESVIGSLRPNNRKELEAIIKQRIEEKGPKCDLNDIDVSGITDMSGLFVDSKFNGDISKWDVSNVRYMTLMFAHSEFNGDISGWDVSGADSMNAMFAYSKFNGDISKWDVSNVTLMNNMFQKSIFNGDISKWDVSNVIDMVRMFEDSQFNGDISKWNVKKVKEMGWMFAGSKFNGDISQWDVSHVRSMICMFKNSIFNGDISKWNVKNVKNMSEMFAWSQFDGDISGWDVKNVKNMYCMFYKSRLEDKKPSWYKG